MNGGANQSAARLLARLRALVRRGEVPLPGTTHRRAGELYLRLFVEVAGLTPEEAVLEPGCGTGRMAEPLTDYLSAAGSYDGFDVVTDAIEWCRQNITAVHPNFRFRHVDVSNGAYNPNGRLDPTEFAFPYPNEAFDFVLLTSVFTHMLPAEVRHYLDEIRRVLRPRGRCFMTFFLLNADALEAIRAGRAKRQFAYRGDGYRHEYRARPEAAIAYREEDAVALIEGAGLSLRGPVQYGRWAGRRSSVGNQDMVVVERPG